MCFSYRDPLERILAGYTSYLQDLPQEKIYLQLDRSDYKAGDTIWFKTYLVSGPDHHPSNLSQSIYVELINARGELVSQIKQLSINGGASGNIDLPDSVVAGDYLIRAYTNWMRNFDEAYFFHRVIRIWDPLSARKSEGKAQSEISVQFFPEGGDLVNGLNSRIAYKAIGQDGLSRAMKGVITDEQKNEIVRFESNSLGTGMFSFSPVKGKSYVAWIEGQSNAIAIPNPKEMGLVLSVVNLALRKEVVTKIETTDFRRYEKLYLIGQTRGLVKFKATVDLASNTSYIKIPRDQFEEGISQITVLDQTGEPLAERIIYIDKPTSRLTINFSTDKKTYAPREKVQVTVNVTDHEQKPVDANLSVSFFDTQQVPYDHDQLTIYSHLYLTSELKGYIEKPGYYFNEDNRDRHVALDLLMMTQGWRKFTVKQAQNYQKVEPEYIVEKGLTLRGKMIDKYSKKPIVNGQVSFLGLDAMTDLHATNTNERGEFTLHDVIYFDEKRGILQGQTSKGNTAVTVVLDSTVLFPGVYFPMEVLQRHQQFPDNLNWKYIPTKEKMVVLDGFEVRAKKPLADKTKRLYGGASSTIKVAGNLATQAALHPLELLQNRVAGLQVTGAGQTWRVVMRGMGSMTSSNEPLIMVDNMPVPIENLNTIQTSDIESIDVWTGARSAIFGSRGANGVINFYTKRDNGDPLTRSSQGVEKIKSKGFLTERQFYSPVYDVLTQHREAKPDSRVTLYWNPEIKVDSTGTFVITFYNSDEVTSVTGIMEGISTTGNPIVSSLDYRVQSQ